MTLEEAQKAYALFAAKSRGRTAYTRPSGSVDRRDPVWRPIDRTRDSP